MAPHSSTLAWKIPWTEKPGGLQSMGLLRVGHDWATSLSLSIFMHWRRKWQPTPVFLPGNPRDGGAWWAAVYGVTWSWTQLKRLSSSSSTVVKKHVFDSNDTHGSNSLSFMSYFRWCPRHGSGYKVNLKEFHILRCPQKSSKLDLQVQMSSLCLAHNLSDEQFSPLLKYQ